MINTRTAVMVGLIATACVAPAFAGTEPAALSALVKLPVKEVTVFKDGHALVLHSGKMPTDKSGNVLMDYLPTPILGTFWSYASDKNCELTSVVASPRKVLVERTALNIREILEANTGADVVITDVNNNSFHATIVGIPERNCEELEKTAGPNGDQKLPVQGNLILLKTSEGTKVMKIERIRNVAFEGEYKSRVRKTEFRNLLTLKLDWKGKPRERADVGMMYVQKGLRWIPSYKVTIDGSGSAKIKLQGTLINDLTDLQDVKMHLVIGVPTFQFKDMVDPISLQKTIARVVRRSRGSESSRLSTAIMSQVADMRSANEQVPVEASPEVTGSEQSEDLFVFDVEHVTLKKNQRMVIPITAFTIPYTDIYTVDIPFTPPPETWSQLRGRHETELGRLFRAPKAVHRIRLNNKSKYPLTTAPALVMRNDRVIAQGIMRYTSAGSETDLELTTAVDIRIEKKDKESERTPNAVRWQDHQYGRIDLRGTIKLTNYRKHPVQLEVTRHVLGNVTDTDHDGTIEMLNVFEDSSFLPSGGFNRLSWWGWYNWPHWWYHFNGVGRIVWKLKLDPGENVELGYTWNYYWR